MVGPSPLPVDAPAVETLRWTAVQGIVSISTFVLAVAAAVFGWYQYTQSLRRDRIKATNDAIVEAAQIDADYSKRLRIPNLRAAHNGLHHLNRVEKLYAKPKTDAEQAELNVFWDASTRVNNYFAAAMALIDSRYLDRKLFFDRLDTFTMVAFMIVYPAFNWLCLQKGLDARSFRAAAELAQANMKTRGVQNEFSELDLTAVPYR